MSVFNPVNILYHEPDLSGTQMLDPNRILWPALAYHVVLTAEQNRTFNIFENTVLKLCQAVSCDYQRLCDITCMDKGFIKLIVAKLRDNGLLSGFEPTADGIRRIEGEGEGVIETQHLSAYVFRDCHSCQWLPAMLPELNKLRGLKEEKDTYSFRIANGVKRISAKRISVSSGRLERLEQEPIQRRDVINILRCLRNINFYCGNEVSAYPKLEEESIAIPDPLDGELVYLYTLAGYSPRSHKIIVLDPFHPCQSDILSENFLISSFGDIANDFVASLSEYSVEDTKRGWNTVEMGAPSISDYLKPLDPKVERLNDKLCIDLLSGYYIAIEKSLRELLKKYDFSSSVSYLRTLTLNLNQMNQFMLGIAAKHGFDAAWKTRCADNPSEAPVHSPQDADLADLPLRKKPRSETLETNEKNKQELKTDSPALQCEFNDKFFSFSGGRYRDNWLEEGNIPSLFGLLLVLHNEKNIVQVQSLLDHGKGDCLCFFSYLTQYRNSAAHGDNMNMLPVKEVVELCRKETIELISDLYPDALANGEFGRADDRNDDTRQKKWNESEYRLVEEFGYGRYQRLPRDIKENLREMLIAEKEGNYVGSFGYAQGIIDNFSFQVLSAYQSASSCHLSGDRVLRRVKNIWPDLPDIFFEINSQKIQSTLNGSKLSMRANILCLMAVLPRAEYFFTPKRIEFLARIMSMRTHSWQESVANISPEEIRSLQDSVIEFANSLLKEYEI